MKLVIFDVDGTLTNTNKIDEQCFVSALALEFGFGDINTNWDEYENVTDAGITQQIFQDRLKRIPSPAEIEKLKKSFVNLLQQLITTKEYLFSSIPGAAKILAELQIDSDWCVAIATGGWYDSAVLKLQNADVKIKGIPVASSDDGVSRQDIVNTAIIKAQNTYKVEDFQKIVFVGDGIWDVKTANNLNIAFIGIAENQQATQELIKAGAITVIPDLQDSEFSKILNNAKVPQMKSPYILHITQRTQWENAKHNHSYVPDSLANEGFIHSSEISQIIKVAHRFFLNQKELVILVINSNKVKAEIRYEAAEAGELFPHIYGALNLDAVEQVIDFAPGSNGYFDLPPQLKDLV
ncbi:DUF952 domain-containing protein [Nostoc sp. FACHB-110]|uniref:DUF952 domain-containing protein n=1 Tax=Nostoc sp. FACHB-110 TaxID=2692834 RepID=UPI001681DA08|nr:DUF952 domain-containing protein [Nostoc sp. FACHB-110]MBD2437221.1 DUF952 domain-containing protein [Nostoc sp. FACHB-110]